MVTELDVTLPVGLWINKEYHREAALQPISGIDEAFYLEQGQNLLPAQRITIQLSKSLTRLGQIEKITPQLVRSLTIGDREALLLHLRRLTLGDSLQCLAICPSCKEKMDLDLKINDMLQPPYPHVQQSHEISINGDDKSYHVNFRLPNGGDQEEAASLATTDPNAGEHLILRRCVKHVMSENDELVDEIPATVATQLPAIMSELDPQAELTLNLSCPFCGKKFSKIFDTAAYLFQELHNKSRHLYKEAHLLAYYYHWSEAEIMGITSVKRQLYLGLLTDALRNRSGYRLTT